MGGHLSVKFLAAKYFPRSETIPANPKNVEIPRKVSVSNAHVHDIDELHNDVKRKHFIPSYQVIC